MLTGRESLVRLIGRRRRSPLPASLAVLLFPSSPAPAQGQGNGEGSGSGEAAREDAAPAAGGGAEWVACPVCGESIRGSDYCVNTHLDICLRKGEKRKLTQSTLLNFKFSKKVAVEPTSKSLYSEFETETTDQTDEASYSEKAYLSLDSKMGSSKANGTISPNGCLGASHDICNSTNVVAHPNLYVKDATNDDGAAEHCSSNNLQTVASSSSFNSCADTNSICTLTVDTMIVGRRFHANIELQEGAAITVQRDPQNPKDHDAIKVLYAAFEYEETLGYLPRELAKLLSPLFDKEYAVCKKV